MAFLSKAPITFRFPITWWTSSPQVIGAGNPFCLPLWHDEGDLQKLFPFLWIWDWQSRQSQWVQSRHYQDFSNILFLRICIILLFSESIHPCIHPSALNPAVIYALMYNHYFCTNTPAHPSTLILCWGWQCSRSSQTGTLWCLSRKNIFSSADFTLVLPRSSFW